MACGSLNASGSNKLNAMLVNVAREIWMTQFRTTSQHTLRLYADIKQAIMISQLEFALLDQSADENTILIWHNGSQKIIARVIISDQLVRFIPEYARELFESFVLPRQSTEIISRLSRVLRSGLALYEGDAGHGNDQPTVRHASQVIEPCET